MHSAGGLIAGGLAGIGVLARREPRPSVAVTVQLVGSRQAMKVRTQLGIRGQTKGAAPAVVVPTTSKNGQAGLALVQLRTGKATPLQHTAGASAG